MKWLNKIIFASFLIILFASCGGDDKNIDLEKPSAEIQLTRESGIYSPGASILINAYFVDNVALKECQVSIASIRSLKGWDTDWDVDMYKIPLSGNQLSLKGVRILEDIPANIYYGDYRLSFKVLDEANNYSIYEIDMLIK